MSTESKRVGTMDAEQVRRLRESCEKNRDGWLDILRENPANRDAAEMLVRLAHEIDLLNRIETVYFRYWDES